MNPFSPFTYYRRHKGRTLLLLGLISLTTLGVCVMVRLLDSTTELYEATESYLTRLSLVYAVGDSLEPGVISQIRANPDVARTFAAKSLSVEVQMIGTLPSGFPLFAVWEADLPELVSACDLRLKEGQLPRPRTNEVVLSEELAEALDLSVGDPIGRSVDQNAYGSIPSIMVLTGILEQDPTVEREPKVFLGLLSREYLDSHELYMDLSPEVLVEAQDGRKQAVERYLEATLGSPRIEVWTEGRVSQSTATALRWFHLIFGVVDILVAIVISLVVGAINRIAMTQRIQDVGLLHAVGYRKGWLVRRLALEISAVAMVGWVAGLGFSWLGFWWLRENLYNSGMALSLTNLTPIWFAAPVPLAAVASVTLSIRQTFARLDAVAIVDRGRLGTEMGDRRWSAKHSSAKPLSSWTFYRRHKRRGLALVVTIALMILGVAFPAFLFSPMIDADQLRYEYLRYVTVISPAETASIDPGVMAQVRLYSDVERVVPAITLGLLIDVPPWNRNYVSILGVSEADMPALVDRFGVHVEEGHLPRPRTNEIAVSRAIATNRGLRVGDRVGKPFYEFDQDIATEMVVVGILSRPSALLEAGSSTSLSSASSSSGSQPSVRGQDLWSGLASYEYLSSHELYAFRRVNLLVIPKEGREAEVDAWLADAVASEDTVVRTYDDLIDRHRQDLKYMFLLLAIVEGVLAVVAALALAILSYISFLPRWEEFGILSALGHSRRWLVLRTLREAVAVVIAAWLMGATVCFAGLIYMQFTHFIPKGFSLNFLNPAPWLFTLPLPLVITVVSAVLVVWMLRRLDPVAIIERR